MEPAPSAICKSCHQPGQGNYCSNCGQSLKVKKITFLSLVHEVMHFVTHMDKGILYTIKELIKHPGTMQLAYIHGNRVRHQKPVSMYFICATLLGLALYWINALLVKYYDAGNATEGFFFHKYGVLFLLLAIPFSALITFLFFYRSGFNYSEIGVMQLYTVSMFLLIVTLANSLRLLWPHFESRYVELPSILLYNMLTFKNFFPGKKWMVITKSLLCASIFFLTLTYLQDFIVEHLHE